MNTFVRGILSVTALAGAMALNAQTADEIINKHLAAIGGRDTIKQVKSLSMDTTVQVMGNEVPSTTVVLDGVGYKTETDFNGTKIVQCFTDKGGWQVNPMAGAADPTPMTPDEYNIGKDQIHVGGALYDYAAEGSKAEVVGKDGGTFKVKLTSKDNVESTYTFDSNTYLLKSVSTKGKFQGQDVDITSNVSDYRKTENGFMLPYAIDIDYGGQFALSIAVKKVEVNKPVDPSVFAMPKAEAPAAAAPKPGNI